MNIHFVGSLGVSMRALKNIAQSFGHDVSGSDINLNGHSVENICNADMLVYTCAVGENNVEVAAARERGLPVFERATFLGMVAKNYFKVLAVSGTHGKTTTTGLLEEVFSEKNPTVHIGGDVKNYDNHVRGREYFVTEACEYKRSFLSLFPNVGIILNMELDHTDYYKDFDDYVGAFKDFAKNSETVVINGDDEGCKNLISGAKFVSFGLNKSNDFFADNIVSTAVGHSFDVYERGKFLLSAEININGKHNIYNALAVVAAAKLCGINNDEIRAGLKRFGGVKRRFEYLGDVKGAKIFTDYAHHPSEIKSTILSARETAGNRVVIVFEPHTYSRTKSLCGSFVQELSNADTVILMPIFAAREEPIEGVSAMDIALALQKRGVDSISFNTYYEVTKYLFNSLREGDIVVFTGAGNINKAAINLLDYNEE